MKLVVIVLGLLALPLVAAAQELEPGAYWPIPVGLNIFTAVNSVNWGDLAFDPSARGSQSFVEFANEMVARIGAMRPAASQAAA